MRSVDPDFSLKVGELREGMEMPSVVCITPYPIDCITPQPIDCITLQPIDCITPQPQQALVETVPSASLPPERGGDTVTLLQWCICQRPYSNPVLWMLHKTAHTGWYWWGIYLSFVAAAVAIALNNESFWAWSVLANFVWATPMCFCLRSVGRLRWTLLQTNTILLLASVTLNAIALGFLIQANRMMPQVAIASAIFFCGYPLTFSFAPLADFPLLSFLLGPIGNLLLACTILVKFYATNVLIGPSFSVEAQMQLSGHFSQSATLVIVASLTSIVTQMLNLMHTQRYLRRGGLFLHWWHDGHPMRLLYDTYAADEVLRSRSYKIFLVTVHVVAVALILILGILFCDKCSLQY